MALTLQEITDIQNQEAAMTASVDKEVIKQDKQEHKVSTLLFNAEQPADKKKERKRDDDGELVTTGKVKELWNEVVPHALKVDTYKDGVQYDVDNSDAGQYADYTAGEMQHVVENIKEDPNAKHVLYKERIFVGVDAQGNEQYKYKYGLAKNSLADRQVTQQGDNTEVMWEKRVADAESIEGRINQLNTEANNNAYNIGDSTKGQGFGSGYTEIMS
ncbi:MAG: hypothetical protein KAG66_07630, partial [Methylococcales bacterium]|nr:hypothetical protein [Methylococcales bacterium]